MQRPLLTKRCFGIQVHNTVRNDDTQHEGTENEKEEGRDKKSPSTPVTSFVVTYDNVVRVTTALNSGGVTMVFVNLELLFLEAPQGHFQEAKAWEDDDKAGGKSTQKRNHVVDSYD